MAEHGVAITREVSEALGSCELTHVQRTSLNVAAARAQHCMYEHALTEAGFEVVRLAAAPDMPDSVFVEDIALIFPDLAVITRPGALSRRIEVPAIADALRPYRPLQYIQSPGTMDGGDVLTTAGVVFVGRSTRTNTEAIDELSRLLAPHNRQVREVDVNGCLHLKSAATDVADGVLLINPRFVAPSSFREFDLIEVDPLEPLAANALRLGDALVVADAYPRTRDRLVKAGLKVYSLDMSELAKAEGGVTCCSLLIPTA